MSRFLHFFLSLIVVILLALLVCQDRKNINISYIIRLIVFEILLAYFLLNEETGLDFLGECAALFDHLLKFAESGTSFVFGGMAEQNLAFFFLKVLCPIVFISALIGVLQYIKVLPFIIQTVGVALSKFNGMGKLESFNAVSTLILGQSENFIAYKDILNKLSEKRMYNMAATAMSTVSVSTIGAYMVILDPKFVIAALILNMFSTFIVLSLINPYDISQEEDLCLGELNRAHSFFEMLTEYILTGFKVAIIVAAMLIGFISLLAALNGLFGAIFGLSFQHVLGYFFYPFAWIIGVPKQEALRVSSIMAIKLVSNEFLAMMELHKISRELSSHSIAILSVFLVSFSNFSSIGIISGALKGLSEHQGNVVSRFGLRLVYGSTLVSMLSASMAGFIIN